MYLISLKKCKTLPKTENQTFLARIHTNKAQSDLPITIGKPYIFVESVPSLRVNDTNIFAPYSHQAKVGMKAKKDQTTSKKDQRINDKYQRKFHFHFCF